MILGSKQERRESRGSARIEEKFPVNWHIEESDLKGSGKILNISSSGLLLQSNSTFSPIDQCIFAIESLIKRKSEYLPNKGRLVWCKTAAFNKTLCGIEFVSPAEAVVARLKQRITKVIQRTIAFRYFKETLGAILFIVMFAMSGFVAGQYYNNAKNMQLSHQIMNTSYQDQVNIAQVYSYQLQEAKAMAVEVEALLAKSKTENADLKAVVAQSEVNIAKIRSDFNEKFSVLTETNQKLSAELAVLTETLRLYEGEVGTFDEGKAVVALFKDKLKSVKRRMKVLKKQAVLAQREAQRERDRIGLVMGNNGYFIREGKSYDWTNSSPTIQVNVEFVE